MAAKQAFVKKTVAISTARTVLAGMTANAANYGRRKLTQSIV